MAASLHIGFDAKRAFFNQTGLGNYSRNLLEALAQYYPQHHYHLYSPKVARRGIEPLLQNPPFSVHYPQGTFNKALPSLWRSWGLGKQLAADNIQLFHGLSNELPLDIQKSNARSIVTIHDLIFLDYPELYPAIDRAIYRFKSQKACELADHVIAISQQTKEAIVRHFGIAESKISVVYQSCHPTFLESPPTEALATIKQRYRLPERYLLYVGAIAERKQILQLVKAFGKLSDPTLNLVLVGNGGTYKQQVQQYAQTHGLAKRMLYLNAVPVNDLAAIYRQALALVYPSLVEGFGIPVIEALHSGVPVITTAGGCFGEAGGDAARYVSAGDVVALANAMEAIVTSPELRQQMIAKGLAHAQSFTPKAFTDGIMEAYEKALS